jgi:Methyltransferase domain
VGNPLEEYFDSHTSGPGIWKWRHYFEIYHRHFEKFRGEEVHVVEIGVYSGGSLGMWKHYFGPRCRIYGVDIEPACRRYEDEQTEIFIGDQADELFWARFVEQVPRIDVVIDDGGHEPEQQITTLEALLPHISPGGVYLCEDMHGRRNPFHAYVTDLSGKLNSWRTVEPGLRRIPSDFQQMVQSIHLYPFVAVIERRSEALTKLHATRHGTEWMPLPRRV